jgi:peptidoglycan/LPS O-acetylase OafA/YrhL
MKHIKQLDSLRAIAVTFVLIGHYFPSFYMWKYFPIGAIGVDIFFVLSGFLITNILINQRDLNDSFKCNKLKIISNFYIRRILRIFPIYYIFIIFIYLFSSIFQANINSALPYLLTYTVNIYFFKKNGFSGEISHLWTLAVEEQFYFIWPWIVLFTKKYLLLYIIIVFISIGVFGKIIMVNNSMGGYLTFNCFDAFGFGALFSYFYSTPKENFIKFNKSISFLAFFSFILFVYGLFHQRYVPLRTLNSIIALYIITYIVMHNESRSLFFKYVLNNKVLIFIGKISYGIYLYHLIVLAFVNSKYFNLHFNSLLPDLVYRKYWNYLFLFENIFLLLLISWFSFILIEIKFLNLKKYFSYNS